MNEKERQKIRDAAKGVAEALEHVIAVKDETGNAAGFIRTAASDHFANAVVELVDASRGGVDE